MSYWFEGAEKSVEGESIRCGRCDGIFVSRTGYVQHRLESPDRGRLCMTIDERFAAGMLRDPMGFWHSVGDTLWREPGFGKRLQHPSRRPSRVARERLTEERAS